MNTTSKIIEELNKKMEEFDLEHERVMIQMRFMSEVERIMEEQNINYKELAQKLGFSASYITQLFQGHKKLNLETIAKIQKVLKKTFSIKLEDYEEILNKKEPTKFVSFQVIKGNLDENEVKQIAV